jgi:TolA-binding protein
MRIARTQLVILSLLLLPGCSQSPATWWGSLNKKARELQALEAHHEALLHEHEKLKRDYYRLEADYMDLRAKVDSAAAGKRNLKHTGTLTGRAPSSIAYKVPKNIKLQEQLGLAYEHFREKRFAEAAVTFEDFLRKPESAALVDASAMYTAGVAWFQLGNFVKARENFEGARQNASGEQKEKIHKKVDLWMRAIDRKSEPDSHHGG